MSVGPTAGNLGGFSPDRFVAGAFNDNLLCSICRYVFDGPVLTPCGHLFCASCLSHWLTACQTLLPSCPECRRTVFAFDVRPVRGLRNYIASLPTYCLMRRSGCSVVLPLEQIQAHEEVCSFRSSSSGSESSPGSTSNGATPSNSRTPRSGTTSSRTTTSNKQPTSTTPQRRAATRASQTSTATSATAATAARSRASGLPAASTLGRTTAHPPAPAPHHHVTDHRPNARQRIALANANFSNNQQQHSASLNDRVARLEEKLQQVRLDIEAAEQRNVWLETQLVLARNNLSLADALRRVRSSTSSTSSASSSATSNQVAAAITSRRRPVTTLSDD